MALQVSRPPNWLHFALWTLSGACGALGLLAAFTVGPAFMLGGLLLLVAALLCGGANVAAVGLGSGCGLPLLYIAWLNRDGPGTVCSTNGSGGSCQDEWSPWPWLLVGVLFTVLPLVVYVLATRRRTPLDLSGAAPPH